MTTLFSRTAGALALASLLTLAGARTAGAATIAAASADSPIRYQTVGSITMPEGVTPGLVYYSGITNGTYDGTGTIDLGTFVVSSLARTTDATFNNSPFQIIGSVGGDASEMISGVLNGQVGPSASNPSLTATITGISQYGNNPLPFTLSLPLNTPMQIALPDNDLPSQTSLAGAVIPAPPIPEPASIAVFAVALGGLGLYRRRAAR